MSDDIESAVPGGRLIDPNEADRGPRGDETHPYLRPRDSATLILIDRTAPVPKVLLGRRHSRHKFVPGKFAAAPETYEILTFGRPIRNRKLTWVSAKDRAFKEAIIMLDVAFVALGLAALALMGVYALALIQL